MEVTQKKKILIVGQGPSKMAEGQEPFAEGKKSGSGVRLSALCGISVQELHELADCDNILHEFHGKKGKGDEFPMEAAKLRAQAIKEMWPRYDRIVLLGSNVAEAFGYDGAPLLQWLGYQSLGDADSHFALVPHPSGVNHWYNDAKNREAANLFLTLLFRGAPRDVVVGDSGVAEIVPTGDSRKARAAYCTQYLRRFEQYCQEWADLGSILIEVEEQELWKEVGNHSFDAWCKDNAPVSHRLCYMVKSRVKVFREAGYSPDDMKQIPAQTAEWASKARNISPAALREPKVREALKLPRQKAVRAIQEQAPQHHVEDTKKLDCKFTVSQFDSITDAYEAFKFLKDETSPMNDFFEFLASEYMDSKIDEHETVRERWEKARA